MIASADIYLAPAFAWEWYLTNLWNPQPGTWVTSIAWTFRLLAGLLIAPFAILTLLDLTSYVIGRTLGLAVHNASTSDKVTALQSTAVPAIRVQTQDDDSNMVEEEKDAQFGARPGGKLKLRPRLKIDGFTPLPSSSDKSETAGEGYFSSPAEEGILELSGYDVFSPAVSRAASQPPSPTAERRSRKSSSIRGPGSLSSAESSTSFTVIDREDLTSSSGAFRRRDVGNRGSIR